MAARLACTIEAEKPILNACGRGHFALAAGDADAQRKSDSSAQEVGGRSRGTRGGEVEGEYIRVWLWLCHILSDQSPRVRTVHLNWEQTTLYELMEREAAAGPHGWGKVQWGSGSCDIVENGPKVFVCLRVILRG
jgi:hypothetical protein